MDQINRAEQQGLIYQTDITSKSIFTFDDIHRMNYEQFNSISKSAGNDLFHPRMVLDQKWYAGYEKSRNKRKRISRFNCKRVARDIKSGKKRYQKFQDEYGEELTSGSNGSERRAKKLAWFIKLSR